jgi:tetratricopeptide (TPR) repeat protein
MLGQALTAQASGSPEALEDALEALERARDLAPTTAEVAMAHAAALLKQGSLAVNASRPSSAIKAKKEAAAAYTAALKLRPTLVEAYRQLAVLHLDGAVGGTSKWRATALRHAKSALALAPALASSYDALAEVLLRTSAWAKAATAQVSGQGGGDDGIGLANMTALTGEERSKLLQAVRASIELSAVEAKVSSNSSGNLPSTSDTERGEAAALAHYRLFRLLASHPDLESGTGLLREAIDAIRSAARMQPSRYAKLAKKFAEFETAERLSKEADRRGALEREAMVRAMHTPSEDKRLQEEEDAAIAAEREAEAAARGNRKEELR